MQNFGFEINFQLNGCDKRLHENKLNIDIVLLSIYTQAYVIPDEMCLYLCIVTVCIGFGTSIYKVDL